jgi:hypothetical protein
MEIITQGNLRVEMPKVKDYCIISTEIIIMDSGRMEKLMAMENTIL